MWSNAPANGLTGVMLSTDALAGPFPRGSYPGPLDRRVQRTRQLTTEFVPTFRSISSVGTVDPAPSCSQAA